MNNTIFKKNEITIRVIPKLIANDNSPLEVSKTMLVVITRVWCAIFPPTMITAPTSAKALPNPARKLTDNKLLDSFNKVRIMPILPTPIDLK